MEQVSRRAFLGVTLAGAVGLDVTARGVTPAAAAPAGSGPSGVARIRSQGTTWTLDNDVIAVEVVFSAGSVAITSVHNKVAGTEYQTAAGGRQLFAHEFDGRDLLAADDGGWTLLHAATDVLAMRTPTAATQVGRELRLVLQRSRPIPVTVTLVFEIYDGRSGLRLYSLIRNDDAARTVTITNSVVVATAFQNRPHTIHYVPNMIWKSTTGALSPLPEDTSSSGKRAELPKKALTVYDSGDGWSLSPELNWKTMRGKGNHASDYMLPPFASINAWHEIDHVRVTTNPEALQLVLSPHEEFEYLSTNLTVFTGDVIDAKMADQEHFRRRFRYHDVTTLFNTNDWDYRGGPGRELPEDYYYTTVIPKAVRADFDMVMLDDLWNTSRDSIEPSAAMAGAIENLDRLSRTLSDEGLLFGLWFSLTGAGHASGRDLADPAQLEVKRGQIETLIDRYGLDHHMIDLTEYWQNEEETAYSHPGDNVYRKTVLTRRMLNELVAKYPHYRPKLTTELDIYPTQGDRNNGLLHLAHNGWGTPNGGVTGEDLSLRTNVTAFGHLPMEATYMSGGRLTGRMEDLYSYMAVRNVKFAQDPGNETYWPEGGIERMARFNRWRKSPRIRAMTEELFRPVYLGAGWDGTDWDSSTGPFVWTYLDEQRSKALLIATGAGGTATRVVANLRWLDDDATYLVSDITLDDDGTHTYAYRGRFSGSALKRPGFPIDLAANSSRGQAFWIERTTDNALQVQYADENVAQVNADANDQRIRLRLHGEPGSTATVVLADPTNDTGLARTVDIDARGVGTATVLAAQLLPPRRVVFTSLDLDVDRSRVEPGSSLRLSARLTVDDFGPADTVRVTATPPEGWAMAGEGAEAARLDTGEDLTAQWTLTVPPSAEYGYVAIPVIADYHVGEGPDAVRRVERSVQVLVGPPGVDYVSDLPFVSSSNGWGPIQRDLTNGGVNPIRVRGVTYAKGLGVHAPSEVVLDLAGRYEQFHTVAGVDDDRVQYAQGSVVFEVVADGTVVHRTGVLTPSDPAHVIDLDVTGVQTLTLRVTDGGDGINNDHADWADAQLHRIE